jgi:hypothetical protein
MSEWIGLFGIGINDSLFFFYFRASDLTSGGIFNHELGFQPWVEV